MYHIKKKTENKESKPTKTKKKKNTTKTRVTFLMDGENSDDWRGKLRQKQIYMVLKGENPKGNQILTSQILTENY